MIGDNSYKYRNKYLVGTIIFFICLVAGILALIIRYNYKAISQLFEEKPIVLTENENKVAKNIVNMKKLEELAYKYDKNEYQNYTLQYLKYLTIGEYVNLGVGYDGFLQEIEKSSDKEAIQELSENKIYVYNLEENVNLNQVAESMLILINDEINPLFVTEETENWNLQNYFDYVAWCEPFVKLVEDYSSLFVDENGYYTNIPEDKVESVKEEIIKRIKGEVTGYNFESSMDAVNIVNLVQKGTYGPSLYLNIMKYYENISQQSRINNFKLSTFGNDTNLKSLSTKIRTRIPFGTTYLNQSVLDLCVETYAEYLIKCGV